jgi:hypothetical protein
MEHEHSAEAITETAGRQCSAQLSARLLLKHVLKANKVMKEKKGDEASVSDPFRLCMCSNVQTLEIFSPDSDAALQQ